MRKKIQQLKVGLEENPAKTHQHKINIECQLINQSHDQYTRVLSIYKQIYKHIQTNQNNNIAKPVAFPKLYVQKVVVRMLNSDKYITLGQRTF